MAVTFISKPAHGFMALSGLLYSVASSVAPPVSLKGNRSTASQRANEAQEGGGGARTVRPTYLSSLSLSTCYCFFLPCNFLILEITELQTPAVP